MRAIPKPTRLVSASEHFAWEMAHEILGAGQIIFGGQRRSFQSQPGLYAQKETEAHRFSDAGQDRLVGSRRCLPISLLPNYTATGSFWTPDTTQPNGP
jgi:hypothetical protein